MLSRRSLLLGTAGVGVVGVGAGIAVDRGALPGRTRVRDVLGLNGEDGVVPDVPAGSIERASFRSAHRLGARTSWALCRPPGATDELPLVVALHGRGGDHERLLAPDLGLPAYLAQAVAEGVPEFAITTVDGGDSYWHERPSGEDAGAMVIEELLPLLAERGVVTERIGLLGWSMGGYGALRLGGLLGRERIAAICAVSAAILSDPEAASPAGFADAAEYEEFSIIGRQDDLAGIPVRIDCGTGDPFYDAVEDYADGFPAGADLTVTFEAGDHQPGYWRRMLPAELDFLGRRLAS